MVRPLKLLLLALLLLPLTSATLVHVNAQGVQDQIEYEILPSQGGANTPISLRFFSTNSSVQNVTSATIFWDGVNIPPLNQSGSLGADGAYYYNLTVPTEEPYSDVGNHTILVNSNILPYGEVNFTFTFNITTFVPSPEYQNLLANYTALNESYTQLLANYTQFLYQNYTSLSQNYTNLLTSYNNEISQYTVLNSNFNALTASYNSLQTSYLNLATAANSTSSSYTSLQTDFQNLNASYVTLIQDYNQLNSSYAGLLSNYKSVANQLNVSRNLNYALIIITIAMAIIIVYLTILRPRKQQKTR